MSMRNTFSSGYGIFLIHKAKRVVIKGIHVHLIPSRFFDTIFLGQETNVNRDKGRHPKAILHPANTLNAIIPDLPPGLKKEEAP